MINKTPTLNSDEEREYEKGGYEDEDESDMDSVIKYKDVWSIERLLRVHRKQVDELKELVREIYPDGDDIFLLRYILSFKGPTNEAVEAVRVAVEWR